MCIVSKKALMIRFTALSIMACFWVIHIRDSGLSKFWFQFSFTLSIVSLSWLEGIREARHECDHLFSNTPTEGCSQGSVSEEAFSHLAIQVRTIGDYAILCGLLQVYNQLYFFQKINLLETEFFPFGVAIGCIINFQITCVID